MTEAFLPPEQKLFLRVVTVTPRKGVNWTMVAALAVEFAVVVAFWGGLAAFLWGLGQ